MSFTVRWVPTGPEMAVSCRTLNEVVTLTQELIAIGKTAQIKVSQNGEDIEFDAIVAASSNGSFLKDAGFGGANGEELFAGPDFVATP